MVTWLSRMERVCQFDTYLHWADPEGAGTEEAAENEQNEEEEEEGERRGMTENTVNDSQGTAESSKQMEEEETVENTNVGLEEGDERTQSITYRITKTANHPKTTVQQIVDGYGAVDFLYYLELYMCKEMADCAVPEETTRFPVYNKISLILPPSPCATSENCEDRVCTTRAIPAGCSPLGGFKVAVPAQTSTVLVRVDPPDMNKGLLHGEYISMALIRSTHLIVGLRVARVQLLFCLPSRLTSTSHTVLLVFIHWYTPFSKSPVKGVEMYRITRLTNTHCARASVIPITQIICSCHLLPEFGHSVPADWESNNVLDKSDKFYINPYFRHRDFYRFRYKPY
jgi:hypothetical protein